MTEAPPRWRDLLTGENGRISIVLAGGVALYAVTVYLVGALLPAMARELNGEALYAWANTAFLTTSIAASAAAGVLTKRLGLRSTYLAAFTLFAVGAFVVLTAPTMVLVVAGRAVQGLGGGALAALAYVSINALLPPALWGRAAALITAMWGIGGIVGPGIGGVFGEGSTWRLAFAGLVVVAVSLGVLAAVSVRAARDTSDAAARFAFGSIAVVMAAVVSISLAAVTSGALRWVLLGAGGLFLIAFALVERASRAPLLPTTTFRASGALPWIYLLVGALAGSVMIEAFLPLFGQQLGGFTPLAAGYLGAIPSVGWTSAQFLSAMVQAPATRRRLRTIGPILVLAGLATFALVGGDLTTSNLAAWLVALFAVGAGVGLAFPHLIVAAMTSVDDPEEAAQASAGISTVQLLCNAIFSALCGVFLAMPSGGASGAQTMAWGVFAVVGTATAVASLNLRRIARRSR
ncbi:MFS transporter [Microbacterium testaceum]|uniref:MFS transporter n=1 Tax=Microbacterium testaceum TaxID=2033 RepID=UPI003433A7E7